MKGITRRSNHLAFAIIASANSHGILQIRDIGMTVGRQGYLRPGSSLRLFLQGIYDLAGLTLPRHPEVPENFFTGGKARWHPPKACLESSPPLREPWGGKRMPLSALPEAL